MEIFYYIGVAIFIKGLYDFFTPDEPEPDLSTVATPSGFTSYLKEQWFSLLQGAISIGWKIGGIFISEQRGLFIIDITLLIAFPFILFTIKDKDQQNKFCKIDTFISLFIVAIILFNHFYYFKN